MTPDFDNLSVDDLFDLEIGAACGDAMKDGMMNLITHERTRMDGYAANPEKKALMHEIDMGNGQVQLMSDEFVQGYRLLVQASWIPPTPEEIKAASLEEMEPAKLIRARPRARQMEAFFPRYRDLVTADGEAVNKYVEAGGSFDGLVTIYSGRSSFVAYTHEFFDALRALLIEFRDLPKVVEQ